MRALPVICQCCKCSVSLWDLMVVSGNTFERNLWSLPGVPLTVPRCCHDHLRAFQVTVGLDWEACSVSLNNRTVCERLFRVCYHFPGGDYPPPLNLTRTQTKPFKNPKGEQTEQNETITSATVRTPSPSSEAMLGTGRSTAHFWVGT